MRWMTIEDVKKQIGSGGDGLFKFVRVKGEYRFIDMMKSGNHCDVVEEGEEAESAGAVSVWPERWKMADTYSSTLKIGALPEDYENLTGLFGVPYKDPFDL